MIWLLIGAALLFLAIGVERGRPLLDTTGGLALGAVALLGLWSPSVYGVARVLGILLAAAIAAFFVARLFGAGHSVRLRQAGLLVGSAAGLFAILGPADGLF